MCVPFEILMWTLLACERRVNIILLTCVYLLSACVNLGPTHMHTFTHVSKDAYVSKFTYGVM